MCSLPGTQLPQSQQALQTLQALQTQQQQSSHGGASTKRLRFKRSMRVRLSTDGSMHLSMEGGGSSASSSPSRTPERPGPPEERLPQRKVHAGAGPLRRSPAVSPASLEDEELPPARAPQVGEGEGAGGGSDGGGGGRPRAGMEGE